MFVSVVHADGLRASCLPAQVNTVVSAGNGYTVVDPVVVIHTTGRAECGGICFLADSGCTRNRDGRVVVNCQGDGHGAVTKLGGLEMNHFLDDSVYHLAGGKCAVTVCVRQLVCAALQRLCVCDGIGIGEDGVFCRSTAELVGDGHAVFPCTEVVNGIDGDVAYVCAAGVGPFVGGIHHLAVVGGDGCCNTTVVAVMAGDFMCGESYGQVVRAFHLFNLYTGDDGVAPCAVNERQCIDADLQAVDEEVRLVFSAGDGSVGSAVFVHVDGVGENTVSELDPHFACGALRVAHLQDVADIVGVE